MPSGRGNGSVFPFIPPDAGTVDHECAPLDYGPEEGAVEALNLYWVWDYKASPGNT